MSTSIQTHPIGGVIGPTPSDRPKEAPLTGPYGIDDPINSLKDLVTASDDPTKLKALLSEPSNITIAASWPERIYMEFRSASESNSGEREVLALRYLNAAYLFRLAAEKGHGGNCEVLTDFVHEHHIDRMEMVTRQNVTAALRGGSVAAIRGLHRLYKGVVAWDMGHGSTSHIVAAAMSTSTDSIFDFLLTHSADVNSASHWPLQKPGGKYYDHGSSLLAYAAALSTGQRIRGDRRAKASYFVKRLLETGARVPGSGALQAAAKAGRVDILGLLLAAEDADVDEVASAWRLDDSSWMQKGLYETLATWTPAHWAAAEGHAEVLDWLRRRGASMERRDLHGRTAEQLLERGVRVAALTERVEKYEAWKKLVEGQDQVDTSVT